MQDYEEKNMELLEEKLNRLEDKLMRTHHIDPNLYVEYDVKRGLRDSAGKGVLDRKSVV